MSANPSRIVLVVGAGVALGAAAGIRAEFQNEVAPTTGYRGTTDITITIQDDPDKDPNANFASRQDLAADGFSARQSSLMRFAIDGGAVPAGSVITAAALELTVRNESWTGFSIYPVLRPWNEGEATYLSPMSGQSWAEAGAAGVGTDRGGVPIATFGHLDGGTVTIPLTDAGVDLIRRWHAGTTPNYGVIVQDFDSWDKLGWDSSEGASPPALVVGYGTGTARVPVTDDTMIAYQPPTYEGWGLGFSGRLGNLTSSLVRWDLRAIPPGVKVTGAGMQFTVNRLAAQPDAGAVEIYPALVPWTEDATWFTYDGVNGWALEGAQALGVDHGAKVGAFPNTCTTPQGLCAVTSTGLIPTVQGWVDDPAGNHGLALQNYANNDDLQLLDSEYGGAPGRRPKLVVDFTWDAGRPTGLYPAFAEVNFTEGVQMIAFGGAPPYRYFISGSSGSTIDDAGFYTAGVLPGQDQVKVVDQDGAGTPAYATLIVLGTALALDGGSPAVLTFTSAPSPVQPLDSFALTAELRSRASFQMNGLRLQLSGQALTVDAASLLDGGRLPGSVDAGFQLPLLDTGAVIPLLITGVMHAVPADQPSVTAVVTSGSAVVTQATAAVPLGEPAPISTGCGCGATPGGMGAALLLSGILQIAARRRASRRAGRSCAGRISQE